MKNIVYLLLAFLILSCSIIKRVTPTEELPLGKWVIKEAYILESRKKRTHLENLEGKQIEFLLDRSFQVFDDKNQEIYKGKWRITDVDFSVSFTDSTGSKSDYKRVLAIISDKDWSILGEANFYKNQISIYEYDKKQHKRYILNQVNPLK